MSSSVLCCANTDTCRMSLIVIAIDTLKPTTRPSPNSMHELVLEDCALLLHQHAIQNNPGTQAHVEAGSLLCQHSHKGRGTRSNSALKASVEGEDEVSHVGRHDACKGWVVASWPSPAAQAVHGPPEHMHTRQHCLVGHSLEAPAQPIARVLLRVESV